MTYHLSRVCIISFTRLTCDLEHRHHHQPFRPLQADVFHKLFHDFLACAFLIQVIRVMLCRSSRHLRFGLPGLRLPTRGVHSVAFFAHFVRSIRATCPANCHLSFSTFSRMSVTFVRDLTSSFLYFSCRVLFNMPSPCFVERLPVCPSAFL